jgi:hypothetical protein
MQQLLCHRQGTSRVGKHSSIHCLGDSVNDASAALHIGESDCTTLYKFAQTCFESKAYAVPCQSPACPSTSSGCSAAGYFPTDVGFSLAERKTNNKKKLKYRCEQHILRHHYKEEKNHQSASAARHYALQDCWMHASQNGGKAA